MQSNAGFVGMIGIKVAPSEDLAVALSENIF
jgi:hypothetical protein